MVHHSPPELPGTPEPTPHDSPHRQAAQSDEPSPWQTIAAACAAIARQHKQPGPIHTVVVHDSLQFIMDNAALMQKHTIEAMEVATAAANATTATQQLIARQLNVIDTALAAIISDAQVAQDAIAALKR